MKKLFLIAVLLTGTLFCTAQEKRHEIAFGYGLISQNNLADVAADVFSSLADVQTDSRSFSGTFSLSYAYSLNRTLSLGAIFCYEHSEADVTSSGVYSGRTVDNYWTFMPSVRFAWLDKKRVALYSKAAIGATFDSGQYQGSHDDRWEVAFQASAFGVEVGGAFRGFLELGYGMQGIVNFGIKYRF